ncbi:MAG: hypothetical protein FJW26_15065 [Acidimicrobiia bacterium]|nr:hypothetical protein [Acidimicrobiia bacterium]
MPKGIVVTHNSKVSSFQIEKVERAKIYGVRRRLAVDQKGRTCARAALTDDGQVLLRAGMTAQGWFDTDGRQVDQKDIAAEDENGKPLELIPSTLGVEQRLEGPIAATEVLDLSLTAVYRIAPEQLDESLSKSLADGQFWRFPFNYRPDYRSETGYLVQNADGIFALVGVPAPAEFLEPQAPPPLGDDDDANDLDFEMM